jgi:ELWxxDGT repeat protein
MRSRIFLLGVVFALLSSAAFAGPSLVADLFPGTERFPAASAGIWEARESGGVFYFAASDPAHGSELWRTDGTPEGTYRLTDICPGACGAEPSWITPFRGEIYFVAGDGFSGRELWASSGARGNARRVRDLCPGPCNSHPSSFAELNGRLFFEATVGTDRGLWSTNGSRRGTTLVHPLCTANDTTYFQCNFGGIHPIGGNLLFQMNDSRLGLWRSDGTPAGTGRFADFGGPTVDVAVLVPVDEHAAFFWATDGLWWTDGTGAGTRIVRTAAELGIDDPYLAYSVRNTIWKGTLVAVLPGQKLLRSDGTPAGTVLLGELPAGSNLIGFAPLQDSLLIALQSPDSLWRTGGTPETTGRVTDVAGYLYGIVSLEDRALLCVQVPGGSVPEQDNLWVTDGTASGTRMLDGAPQSLGCGVQTNPVIDGRLLYIGQDWKVWSTDGTAGETALVHDFGEAPASAGPRAQIGFNGRLLFSARTAADEAPLFLSDGTTAGTGLVSRWTGWAQGFVRLGGRVLFQAFAQGYQDGYAGLRSLGLWSSDGTEIGTREIQESISSYRSPIPVGKQIFFTAAHEYSYYGDADLELFHSGGSRQGTGMVKNINPYGAETGFHHTCYDAPSNPGPGIDLKGRLLFTAEDGIHGRELWVSDGTAPGTRLVKDIDPRRLQEAPASDCDDRQETGVGADPAGFVRLGNGALFAASDGTAGRELWWSDGTPAGTRRVKDLRPGRQGSNPHDLVLFRGKIWFIAANGAGEGLWRTDGTAAGTVLVHSLGGGALPSWAGELTATADRLFLRVFNEATGAELWTSRGDAASTHMVADLRPGAAGASPQWLTVVGNVVVFAADDGVHGLEPWQSNGTAAGTVLLGDIQPGFGASSPGPFTAVAGGRVLTGADDGVHGRELWAVPLR